MREGALDERNERRLDRLLAYDESTLLSGDHLPSRWTEKRTAERFYKRETGSSA
jgi:hypothetical protein